MKKDSQEPEKESVLDKKSNYEIYNNQRYDGTTKEQWKEMSKKEKWIHFKEYYLKFVIAGIVLIGIIIYVVIGMSSKKTEDTFYCGMLDDMYLNPNEEYLFKSGFWKYLQDDTEYLGSRDMNTIYFQSYGSEFQDSIKLGGDFDSSKFDVIISNEATYQNYANAGLYANLKEILDDTLLEKIKPYVIYQKDSNSDAQYPCGIRLPNNKMPLYHSDGTEYDNPVMAVFFDTKRRKVVIEYIKFLFDND